jgi:lipopolysaccharide assembly outer membrane protein LptD (OstA)
LLAWPAALYAAAAPTASQPKLPTGKQFLQQQMELLQPAHQPNSAPAFVQGNVLTYDARTDTYTVTGAAKLHQRTTRLTADKISLRHRSIGYAEGHVHLVDTGVDVHASKAWLDLNAETARLLDARGSALGTSYYMTAKEFQKFPGQRYKAIDATLTTCKCNLATPDWSLQTKEITIHLGGKATAHAAYFDVLGHPLIPVPFAQFDTNEERHSGFLFPNYGESSLNGFEYSQAYFLDIDRSQDMTGQFDLQTSTRIGGQLEYRLMNGAQDYISVTGSYFNESIRSRANRESDLIDPQIADPFIPTNRWGLVGVMQQYLTPDWFLYANAMSTGDSLFYREIPRVALSSNYGWNSGTWQTARFTTSNLGLFGEFNNSYLQFAGTYNQDLIQPQEFALEALPQLLWTGFQSLDGGLAYLDYNASAVNYWREAGIDGLRLDIDPQLTVPWRWSRFLDGWFTVGADAAGYDVSGHQVNVIPVGTQGLIYNNGLALGPLAPGGLMGRVVPDFSTGVRSALVGSYNVSLLGLRRIETLTQPFVVYTYIPTIDQNQFPIFDSVDRIEPRSMIDYGVSLRIFGETGPKSGESGGGLGRRAMAMLGPSFTGANGNLTAELLRLNVEQIYDTSHALAPNGTHLSDLTMQATVFPTALFSGSATVDWSSRVSSLAGLDAITFSMAMQPPGQSLPDIYTGRSLQGSFVQLAYTYAAPTAVLLSATNPTNQANATNSLSTVSLQSYVGLFHYFGMFFEPQYDFSTRQLLSTILGFRLKSRCDCWIVDFALDDTYYPAETAYTFQITLGGLGSYGGSPFGYNPFQIMGLVPMRRPVAAAP